MTGTGNWLESLTEVVNVVDDFVWGLPLICLILFGVVVRETNDYFARLRRGKL